MKLWYGHESAHSMRLYMVGKFREPKEALHTHEIIGRLSKAIAREVEDGRLDVGSPPDSFSEQMLSFLMDNNIFHLSPRELEQFEYDIDVKLESDRVTVYTDEIDVSAFLKLLVDGGARVEVFSLHDYPSEPAG